MLGRVRKFFFDTVKEKVNTFPALDFVMTAVEVKKTQNPSFLMSTNVKLN